jgi:hypothetical protein
MSTNPKKWRDYEEPLSSLEEALNAPLTGPSRSWTEINAYCWYQEGGENGFIAHRARSEQQVMRRTTEGQIKLLEILLKLRNVEKQNQAIVADLFSRLTLPKE